MTFGKLMKRYFLDNWLSLFTIDSFVLQKLNHQEMFETVALETI
jgi:hypothetical protein